MSGSARSLKPCRVVGTNPERRCLSSAKRNRKLMKEALTVLERLAIAAPSRSFANFYLPFERSSKRVIN
ncbi:hypothetical protein F8B43_2455 [Methylorubrum populi]|uniref:Uncharacterized protein n=1 Tax=Methylorubrum populi TaxID=223967 RepID=A0A833MWK6_9HYPH|nr:hypothetical protein F8B43_2455 [Methylorubrum populi]